MHRVKRFFPEFSEAVFDQLASFCALVHAKNEDLNLISRKDIDRIIEGHLFPSLAIYKKHPFEIGATVLDIGTGGGFPGLPLAVTMPNVHFTLIDATAKKIKAVETFAATLGLKNVTCIHDRVENLHARYHYVIGRAVARSDCFFSWAKAHLKPHGRILYLSGGEIAPENKMTVVDLFMLYDQQFCATKKLLIVTP
ncbi:MAG: 16S rRNA (guanine(527)-N(7))-methyltransferase RsmG [Puniceicoccales bacterium]|jgi:16S rRNA (guanine527-N7)-methyltransferase|nr:16S rRNA (guanine(527)-N(7))-methyltransferase RsmG [Puniceicoccales bacterium]